MTSSRRWITCLLLAVLLLAGAAPAWVSAAPARASLPDQPPPTPTAPPVATSADPATPAGAFISPPAGCGALAPAQVSNVTPQNIPDAIGLTPGIITSTIHISTAAVYLWQLVVTTAISHVVSGDLDISLISPHGTVVTLSSNNGGSNANVFNGTAWFDVAANGGPGVVTLASFISGTVKTPLAPEEPLSALLGENPNGDWRLVVKDTQANGATGRLNSWSLQLDALTQAPHNLVSNSYAGGTTPIPDAGPPVTRTIYMTTLPAPLSTLTLTTDIPHTWPGDLDISLVTPGGVTLTVSHRNGAGAGYSFGNGSVGTAWYDAAGQANPPGPVTDAHYLSGTVQTALAPQEAFGAVQGQSGSGYWKLIVQDKAGADVGTLLGVSLQVVVPTCLPDLRFESNAVPNFPKLGGLATYGWGTYNQGALAHNVNITGSLSGPFPFQGLFADSGLACGAPAPGTLNAAAHCSLASLASIGEPGMIITFSTPLVPASAPVTIAVSSTEPDLKPADNVRVDQLKAFAHSANGNPWDVTDLGTQSYALYDGAYPDSGSLIDGGQDAFDEFGGIQVRVFTAPNTPVDAFIDHLGLTYAPGASWRTTTPQTLGPVTISRGLLAPSNQDWLRYVDTFTNHDSSAHTIWVAWGGNLGSDSDTVTLATSSGDATLTAADTWAVTHQDLASGATPDAVLGYALRGAGDSSYQGPFDTAVPLTGTVWSSAGDDLLSNVYQLSLPAGATKRLAYFVYRGLAETSAGPADCGYYGGCVTPAASSQVTLARNTVAALVANAPFCDLPPAVRGTIVNWPGIGGNCKDVFLPVGEK